MPKRRSARSSIRRAFKRRRRSVYRRKRLRGRRSFGVHSFRRLGNTFSVFCSPTVETVGDVPFNFSQIQGNSEFQGLFDAYKLNKVVCRYMPNYTEASWSINSGNNTSSAIRPQLYTCQDWDSVGPATIAAMREYGNCKVRDPFRAWSMAWRPRIRPQPDNGGAGSVYPIRANPWLDMAVPGVIHNGLTVGCSASTLVVGGAQLGRIEVIYYFSTKNLR